MATTPATTVAELRERFGDDHVLLTRAEAAEVLRRSVPTLERWAKAGIGPEYTVIGGRALYPLSGLKNARTRPGRAA